jgi:putative SOS response-associated peptidase YedK
MCGRFAFYTSLQAIKKRSKIMQDIEELQPNYNVAPHQEIALVIKTASGNQIKMFQWGLVPFWAENEEIGSKLINARAETISEKPSFRNAFKQHRCLIPANGFYEWRKSDKQPFFIRQKDSEMSYFAGIYEIWEKANQNTLYTFSIITTEANAKMAEIHHRMPVIIHEKDDYTWLTECNKKKLLHLLQPLQSEEIEYYPVSKLVNDVHHNHPELLKELKTDKLKNDFLLN